MGSAAFLGSRPRRLFLRASCPRQPPLPGGLLRPVQAMATLPMVCALFCLDAAASIMDGALLAAKQSNFMSIVQVGRPDAWVQVVSHKPLWPMVAGTDPCFVGLLMPCCFVSIVPCQYTSDRGQCGAVWRAVVPGAGQLGVALQRVVRAQGECRARSITGRIRSAAADGLVAALVRLEAALLRVLRITRPSHLPSTAAGPVRRPHGGRRGTELLLSPQRLPRTPRQHRRRYRCSSSSNRDGACTCHARLACSDRVGRDSPRGVVSCR
jgi:hypothetical protein